MSIELYGEILSFMITFMEMVCFTLLISTFFKPRIKTIYCFFILFAVSYISVSLLKYTPIFSNFILKFVVILAITAATLQCLYKGNFFGKLAVLCIGYVLLYAFDTLVLIFFTNILGYSPMEINSTPALFTYRAIASYLISFLIIRILCKIYTDKKLHNLSKTDWLLISFIPFISVVLFAQSYSLAIKVKSVSILTLLSILSIFLLNLVMFYIIDKISERNRIKYENLLLNNQLEFTKNNLASLKQSDEQTRSIAHDFKNHIEVIDNLIEEKQYSQARQYIEKLGNAANDKRILTVHTNNLSVDAILNNKSIIAKNNDISFFLQSSDLSNVSLDELDLVTILSNLLDNAITACKKVCDNKYVNTKLEVSENKFIISVSNSVSEKAKIIDNELQTTKEDPLMHGIGLKNVKKVVEKYGGNLAMSCSDELFKMVIIFTNKIE